MAAKNQMLEKPEEILPEETTVSVDTTTVAPAVVSSNGIDVGDPQLLRPRELPLVVKPSNGAAWKNDAQAEYARNLNGYAYKNPKKWAQKKDALIEKLVRLGTNPEDLFMIKGGEETGLSYKNRAIGGE